MKSMKVAAFGTIVALGLASGALAQQSNPHHGMTAEQHQAMMSDKSKMHHGAAAANVTHGEGVVKAVDAANQTVTIAHEPIAAKKWPAMTMTFKAAKSLLRPIKTGQRVAFAFKEDGSGHVITKMTPR